MMDMAGCSKGPCKGVEEIFLFKEILTKKRAYLVAIFGDWYFEPLPCETVCFFGGQKNFACLIGSICCKYLSKLVERTIGFQSMKLQLPQCQFLHSGRRQKSTAGPGMVYEGLLVGTGIFAP